MYWEYVGEHPWHVGLVREESKTGVLGWIRHLGGLLRTTTFCGATMINPRWLITAAHCIRPTDRTVDLRCVIYTLTLHFIDVVHTSQICQYLRFVVLKIDQ